MRGIRMPKSWILIQNSRTPKGFAIKFIRDGKERRNMSDEISIRKIGDSRMSVFSPDELKELDLK
jgi:hypothetical protein